MEHYLPKKNHMFTCKQLSIITKYKITLRNTTIKKGTICPIPLKALFDTNLNVITKRTKSCDRATFQNINDLWYF